MRSPYFDAEKIRGAAASGSAWQIHRALLSAKRHAADFASLVPCPALAASFEADAAMLERALVELRCVALEPVA